MDNVIQAILGWQIVLFGLGITAITSIAKKNLEFFLDKDWVPASKTSRFWKEVFLPLLPVLLGPGIAYLSTSYPYPEDLKITSGRVFFGLVAGLLSGLFFRVIKGTLAKDEIPSLTAINTAIAPIPGIEKVVSIVSVPTEPEPEPVTVTVPDPNT